MAARKQPATLTADDYKRVAESIARTSEHAKAMNAAGLTRRAIVTLLHDATAVPRKDIVTVLDAAEALASWCLKPR